MENADLEFFARCASGFESLLADELKTLGIRHVRPLKGGVAFFGPIKDGYKACLWSRVATRIQLVLTRVDASNAQALYNNTLSFEWEEHVPSGATIAVAAHGTNAHLRKTTFTALKAKDALCDRLRDVRGSRPNVDTANPNFMLDIALHEHKATLYLNLSGESLHRRGYRKDKEQTEAPLKETLAAGMLSAAGWPEIAQVGGCLIDPLCGSGTIAIEAALILSNTAPGILRSHWGFEGWKRHSQNLWDQILEDAVCQKEYPSGKPHIIAGDRDAHALAIARDNAERAGVAPLIQFIEDDAAQLGRHLRWMRNNRAPGLLATNPPYGKRLLTRAELPLTYGAISRAVEALPSSWTVAIITPDAGIDSALGRTPRHTLPCFNGPIPVWIRCYHMSDERLTCNVTSLEGHNSILPISEKSSSQFATRFRKMARDRARWAQKQGICCYRVYDADLPDYAYSIDLYASATTGAKVRFVYLSELKRPRSTQIERAARRLTDAISVISTILDVDSTSIFVQTVNGKRPPRDHVLATVCENSLKFEVDANDPHAVLPLRGRKIREQILSMARGRSVACLFATGTAALVYALAGGATSAVVVDASAKHLKQIRHTMRANGFSGKGYRTVQSEIRSWLDHEAKNQHAYDLFICLPPSWLSAKAAGGQEWATEADCYDLVRQCADALAPGGTILLGTLEGQALPNPDSFDHLGLVVADISSQVLPYDFERSPKKPRCLLLQKAAVTN